MKIKKEMSILVLVLVFGIVQLTAGNPNQDIRVKSYELDVTFIPTKHAMKGKAVIRFVPDTVRKEKLVFYLHGELSLFWHTFFLHWYYLETFLTFFSIYGK